MSDVKERVKQIMAEVLEVEADEIHDETDFFTDFDANSMIALEAVVLFEKEFGITIPDTNVKEMRTFRGLMQLLEELLAARDAK